MTVIVEESSNTVEIVGQQASVLVQEASENNIELIANSSFIVSVQSSPDVTIELQADGPQGAPGPGIIASGTTNQVLSKASNANFDTYWQTLSLSGLSDVDVSQKTDGSVLVYDEGSQKFTANSSLTFTKLTDGGNF
jgi:hypothetical protein